MRLTERRFEKARPILDHYRDKVRHDVDAYIGSMEKELEAVWKVNYQGLKPLMIDLSKRSEYTLLAARYMEESWPCVVTEFKSTLARLYGMPYFDSPDREAKREQFWSRFKQHA